MLPKISIITPSRNCAAYIGICIESVLAQNYDNFEHIIVDGASEDGTIEILKQYPHLKWISEPDNGEAEALNKALRMVTGDIIGWLNADDSYLEGVFHRIAEEIKPQKGRHLIYGKTLIIDDKDEFVGLRIPKVPLNLFLLMHWFRHLHLYQPSIFHSRELVTAVGFFREDLYFSIDLDYWLRIAAKGYEFHYIDQILSNARLVRPSAKSAHSRIDQEKNWLEVSRAYLQYLKPPEQINFWKDYYLYRLPNQQKYTEPLTMPDDQNELLGLSLAMQEMGLNNDLISVLQHFINTYPDSTDARWLLGEIFYWKGASNEAKKIFEEILAIKHLSSPIQTQPTVTQAVLDHSHDVQPVAQKQHELTESQEENPRRQKKILVFFPHNPCPPKTGAHKRFLSIIDAFKGLEYEIILFSSNLFTDSPWQLDSINTLQNKLGVKVELYQGTQADLQYMQQTRIRSGELINWDMHTTPGLRERFHQLFHHFKPDIILINYALWGNLADGYEYKSALRMIDTHDLVTLNTQMRQILMHHLGNPPFNPEHTDPKIIDENFFLNLRLGATPDEYAIYNRYDLTIAISSLEAKVIREHTQKTKVEYLPMTASIEELDNTYADGPLFVIGPNPFNIQGHLFFGSKVLPNVLSQLPDFKLRVIGSYCNQLVPVPGIRLLGFVQDLKPLYANSPFAICPLIGGTGQQVKIVEAMAHGVPVIALRNVAENSPILHGVNGFIANDADEFAEYTIQLFRDRALCRKFGQAARKTIADNFSQSILTERLERIIESKPTLEQQIIHTPTDTDERQSSQNILWVRTDSIGDAVLSSSMLPHIREKFKHSRITVLCQEHIAPLYETCPHINEIIPFNAAKAYQDENYRNEIMQRLSGLQFDLSLNSVYSREPLTDFFAIGSNAKERIALNGDTSNMAAEVRDRNNQYYSRLLQSEGECKTELERHRDFLKQIGIEISHLEPVVWLTPEDEKFADNFFKEHNLKPEHTIVLFAGVQNNVRIYEHYGASISQICKDKMFTVIAVGTSNDRSVNQHNLDAIGVHTLNLSGETTLRQTAAILKRCRLAVGAETSLAHIACAVGTPNVILLGGGHFGRFMPYSPYTSAVSLPLECFGCNWVCRHRRPHCIRDVSPEVFAEAIRQTLEKPSDKPRVFIQGKNLWNPDMYEPEWEWSDKFLDNKTVETITIDDIPKTKGSASSSAVRTGPSAIEIRSDAVKTKAPSETKSPDTSEPILVAVNLVPFKDERRAELQQTCINSINELKALNIMPLNICYPDELIQPEGWEVSTTLIESADKKLNLQGKRKPFVTDIFNAASKKAKEHSIDWFIITNGDVMLTPSLIKEARLLFEKGYENIAVSRTDVEKIDIERGYIVGSLEVRGYDVFICRSEWWENNKHRFQPYIFGERAWDDAYTAIMASHSKFHIFYTVGLCYHFKHSADWHDTGPYANYNMSLFLGVDRMYVQSFSPFVDEVLNIPQENLTFQLTSELIRKYFPYQNLSEAKSKELIPGIVSLVILVSDSAETASVCFTSINKYTKEVHEIIIVQTGRAFSSQINLSELAGDNLKTGLIDGKAKGYSNLINRAIAGSSEEYVLILDDSFMATEDWISGMLEGFTAGKDVGIIGPMMNNINGRQRVTIPGTDAVENIDSFAKTFREQNRYRRIASRNLSAGCVLFRRDLIEKIGLFDEQFDTAQFAVDDYCLRASLEGYRNFIAGDVFIYQQDVEKHAGNSGTDAKDKKLFVNKWSRVDQSDPLNLKLVVTNALHSAEELHQRGTIDNAIAVLLDGIRLVADEKRLHYALVDILIEEKRFKDCLDVLKAMPEGLRRGAEWYEAHASCNSGLNQFEEAERKADEAIALNGTSPAPWNIKGFIAFKKGNRSEAERLFTKAIEYDRGFGEAYCNLAALKWLSGDKEDASALFEKAFILSPSVSDVALSYYTIAANLKQFDRAANLLKEAIALYPFNKKLRFTLMDILLQQAENHQAMKATEEAMLTFGIDDHTLSLALGIREKIGPMEIKRQGSRVQGFKGSSQEEKQIETQMSSEYEEKGMTGQEIKDSSASVKLQGSSEQEVDGSSESEKDSKEKKNSRSLDSSISLCMIVKNEEKNIAHCLMSVRPVVDEMIIVDTGSPDRTKDIAIAFGAQAYDFVWTDSFADARNFAISKAEGSWILVLDADEVISNSDHNALKEIVRSASKPVAYSFITRNYVDNPNTIDWIDNNGQYAKEEAGRGWFPGDKVRLFPKDDRIIFEFPVHERVEPSLILAGVEIQRCAIPVHHYGKLDIKKSAERSELYYRLGKIRLAESGKDNVKALYDLAVQASEVKKYEEALEYLQQAIAQKPDFARAHLSKGNAYFNLGRYEDAISSYGKASELDPDLMDASLLRATCEIHVGKAGDAIPLIEDLLRKTPSYLQAVLPLAVAYICEGQKSIGAEYLKNLYALNINIAQYITDFAKALMSSNRISYAASLLLAAQESNSATEETAHLLNECYKMIQKNQ